MDPPFAHVHAVVRNGPSVLHRRELPRAEALRRRGEPFARLDPPSLSALLSAHDSERRPLCRSFTRLSLRFATVPRPFHARHACRRR